MRLPNYEEAKKREKKDYQTVDFKLDDTLENKYATKTYFLKTYGCQMNERDGESIKAILEQLGFSEVLDYKEADLVLLNTCSIRENAHNKAFGMLGRLKHEKETKKDLMIGLCGCMAQEQGVVDTILNDYKFVNFVFGTHNMHRLPVILDEATTKQKQEIEVFASEEDLIENMPVKRENDYKAFVNIIYGCDKFCTYCIVPYTRGGQRSRKKEDILKEINDLVEDGYKEVTLLGQNVNAYGKDLDTNYGLAELIEDIAKTDIPRIRFMTSHPWDFTESLVDVMARYKNVMPSVHLPVQSGSSKVLKLMGRKYTKESYLDLFHQLKTKIPNISISTDIIVGFPSEDEEDFNETLSLVKECKFDNAFTFIFSPRENTPAANLENKTTEKEKEERLQKLNALVNEHFLENNEKLVEKIVHVLVEDKSEKREGFYYGHSEQNKLINFTSTKEHKAGDIVDVLITEAKTWSLDGKYHE